MGSRCTSKEKTIITMKNETSKKKGTFFARNERNRIAYYHISTPVNL